MTSARTYILVAVLVVLAAVLFLLSRGKQREVEEMPPLWARRVMASRQQTGKQTAPSVTDAISLSAARPAFKHAHKIPIRLPDPAGLNPAYLDNRAGPPALSGPVAIREAVKANETLATPDTRSTPGAAVSRGFPEEAEENAIVELGGGAMEMRVPTPWKVAEVPFGREIRLVVSATDQQDRVGMPLDGMWISYHVRRAANARSANEIASLVPARLRTLGKEIQEGERYAVQVGGQSGFGVDFRQTRDEAGSERDLVGSHLIVQTEWGLCEVHLRTPATDAPLRMPQFRAILSRMKLNAPPPPEIPRLAAVEPARMILGSWKAFSSHLRLRGDGRVEITLDAAVPLSLSSVRTAAGERVLTGTFEAQDDLLMVVWDDGSKLNFRWRQRGENLLLTDHEGKTSLLRRVLD